MMDIRARRLHEQLFSFTPKFLSDDNQTSSAFTASFPAFPALFALVILLT